MVCVGAPGSPRSLQSLESFNVWAAWGLRQDALGPGDKGNQFRVLLAAK